MEEVGRGESRGFDVTVVDWQFALYLQHQGDTLKSVPAVEKAVHATSCISPITHAPIIQATEAGLRRSLAKPTVMKEPITVEMLKQIAPSAAVHITLTDSRLIAYDEFACFRRFPEDRGIDWHQML